MYIIKEYENEYNKKVNKFIISILVDEYGFEEYREVLENEDNSKYINNDSKFLIALDKNNNVIGTILIYKHNEESMQIRKFYVRKDYRGKGISKELYNKAINFCREKSFTKIFIGTNNKLERAIKFYLNSGFYEIEYEDKKNADNRYFEKNV